MFKTPHNLTNLIILGEVVPVTLNTYKCEQEEADGLCIDKHIFLRHEYDSEEHYKRVVTHEAFHALCEILGCQLDIHMEETLAHQVSKMMTLNFIP